MSQPDSSEVKLPKQGGSLVVVKDLGEKVELSVMLDVEDKELGNFYKGAGFSPKDLKSYGFNVIITTETFIDFVEAVVAEHTKMQQARAETIKTSLDVPVFPK